MSARAGCISSRMGLGGVDSQYEVQYLHVKIEDDHPAQIIVKVAMLVNHFSIVKFSH